MSFDWNNIGEEQKLNIPKQPDLVRDLLKIDVLQLYEKMIKTDKNRSKYGFLALMAGCSEGQVGALNAESYAERVNSVAKLVLTEGNTLLGDKCLKMLVVLRMNEELCRRHTRELIISRKL